MGATGTPSKLGSGQSFVQAVSKADLIVVIADFTMSASYANPGGDTVTLPDDVKGARLAALLICNPADATRMYAWDGNKVTPKIRAFSAFATEVGNGINLSAVTLTVAFIYQS